MRTLSSIKGKRVVNPAKVNSMADSPTKRQRTRALQRQLPCPDPRRHAPGSEHAHAFEHYWPVGQLPVEIFTLIISQLPRASIQSMRLVCREFERKVSEYLFRVVVVPFKPELYGINLGGSTGVDKQPFNMLEQRGSMMLQDKGMRVFESFGRHILRFAMSFEIDYAKLLLPPSKSDQEAIVAFWGTYKWPHTRYRRYAQLEGLEQTADETRTMAKALQFMVNASELGISMDGGLGWLAGPDLNPVARDPSAGGMKLPVFGESRFATEALQASEHASMYSARPSALDVGQNTGSPGQNHRMRDRRWPPLSGRSVSNQEPGTRGQALVFGSLEPELTTEADIATANHREDNSDWEGDDFYGSTKPSQSMQKPTTELKPNQLSSAQREVLLETEWAQRAFLQSYVIAIVDNSFTFKNITAFKVARLPHRHVSILRRTDFWDNLPNLNSLSMVIIPDWREITKLPTTWVQDTLLQPSHSLDAVYQLLNEQIANRANVKTLHLEWLGGGEHAAGIFARNQHVMPAPLVKSGPAMVDRRQHVDILALPFVENLTLKNCWVSPHVMTSFLLDHCKTNLQTFSCDSVSLIAPVRPGSEPRSVLKEQRPAPGGHPANAYHPIPTPAGGVNAQISTVPAALGGPFAGYAAQGLGSFANTQYEHLLATTWLTPLSVGPSAMAEDSDHGSHDWLDPPRVDSWSAIIDRFTPGLSLAEWRFLKDRTMPSSSRKRRTLTRFSFKSCGYAWVSLNIDQSMVVCPERCACAGDMEVQKRISDCDGIMMKPRDPYLATIINGLPRREIDTLYHAFDLTSNWDPELDGHEYEAATLDGFQHAGKGRFTGTIAAREPLEISTNATLTNASP